MSKKTIICNFGWQKPRRELQYIKELFRIRKWKYKLPRGLLRGTFWKNFPSQNEIIFLNEIESDISPQNRLPIDFYWSKSFSCRSRWSVWSTWTFATIQNLHFRMDTGSYGGKIRKRGGTLQKNRVEIQNWTCEGSFEVEMMFEHILEVPALIPVQFPYKFITLMQNSKIWWKKESTHMF